MKSSLGYLLLPLATVATYSLGASSHWLQQQKGVSITFLANEGVMLSSGESKVLIDALFLKYKTGFAMPADSTQRALSRALPPFDAVDLILVTHRHGDHFHPAPVAAHLQANPRVRLLTSAQVIDSLRGRVSSEMLPSPRVTAIDATPGKRRREVVGDVTVDVLGVPHGGRRHNDVEHLAYIVELGGQRVLHVGDADVEAEAFAPFRLDTTRIDVALVPEWMVTSAEGRRTIQQVIRPRHVVAFHVSPDAEEAARVKRDVSAAIPGALTFTQSLSRFRSQ
jgi:L-ascorbate metabolism protein UlaG (beta-lactamase superfamily)